ncbi:MAG: hypothetical protein IJ242_02850 [Clostridia bacterium]|nr:hypothetical protein [Clostridia bacterium]
MSVKETVLEQKEHQAIVFRMNRKEAAAVARYIKDHSGSPEMAFAIDVDAMEMIVQAKTAQEEDFLIFEGESDVFDIVDSEIEEETIVETEEEDQPAE